MNENEVVSPAKAPEAAFSTWGDLDLMGHKHLTGWIEEVQRFGVPMVRIEPVDDEGTLGNAQYYNPTAIYSLVPRTEEDIRKELAERRTWRADRYGALAPPQITAHEESGIHEGPGGLGDDEEEDDDGIEGDNEDPDESVVETTVRSYPLSETRRRQRALEE